MDLTVTIAGSYRKNFPRIAREAATFRQLGCTVLRPQTDQVSDEVDGLVRLEGDPHSPAEIERQQLEAISASDLLYIVNPGGHVGPSSVMQAGFAHGRGVAVFTAEPPYERAASAIVLGSGSPQQALEAMKGRQQGEGHE